MRRRPPDLSAAPPPTALLVFDVEQWPGGDPGERFDAFRAARRAHLERYGWPGGEEAEVASLPDGPWWEGIV